jgi:protein-S-isoprenylcysteine O-methyltransferase Ste14
MLSSLAMSIVLFGVGVLIGIYFPLALAYVRGKFRGSYFSMKIAWKIMLRLAAILFLFFLLLAIFGLFLSTQLAKQFEHNSIWLGFGIMAGFIAGIILFFIGLRRGRAQAVSSQSS